ncbi:hypothetical protein P9112_002225 [Eukaryota sp. TZLM1-RC]
MIDVLLLLEGRFVADRGDTIQFHHKETFAKTKGTKIIELKEQRVGPNKIELVYSDAWIAKLKAWVEPVNSKTQKDQSSRNVSKLGDAIYALRHAFFKKLKSPFALCWESLQRSDFYWPNIRNDLLTHVNSCIPCQKTAHVLKTLISSTGSLNAVRRPFKSLHCDSIGPFSVDTYGHK